MARQPILRALRGNESWGSSAAGRGKCPPASRPMSRRGGGPRRPDRGARVRAAGCDVLVLEARRTRRRSRAEPHAAGRDAVELGGEWIGPGQHRMSTRSSPSSASRRSRPTTTASTCSISPGADALHAARSRRCRRLARVDLAQSQLRFDRHGEAGAARGAVGGRRAAAGTRRRSRPGSPQHPHAGARFCWDLFAEAVFAAEPQDLSLLHALFATHSAGGLHIATAGRGGARQERVIGGAAAIATRMAEPVERRDRHRRARAPDRTGHPRCRAHERRGPPPRPTA